MPVCEYKLNFNQLGLVTAHSTPEVFSLHTFLSIVPIVLVSCGQTICNMELLEDTFFPFGLRQAVFICYSFCAKVG